MTREEERVKRLLKVLPDVLKLLDRAEELYGDFSFFDLGNESSEVDTAVAGKMEAILHDFHKIHIVL